MAWQINGTPDTLTGDSATLTISDLTSTIFNVILSNNNTFTGIPQANIRVGNSSLDDGSSYASRRSRNGTAEAVSTNVTSMQFGTFVGGNVNSFGICYFINIATEEKLQMSFYTLSSATGAGTAPDRQETVNKWVNTTNQFDVVGIINTNTGSWDTGSNLSALGTD